MAYLSMHHTNVKAVWQELAASPADCLAHCLEPRPPPSLRNSCSAQDDPTTYTGYQVELFRLVATELGWKEGRDWYFSCEDWTPMLEDLLSANGTCTMSAAGVCRALRATGLAGPCLASASSCSSAVMLGSGLVRTACCT